MIRRWLRLLGLVLGLIACVPLHYAWKLVGARSPWPRRFLFWVGYVAGLRITVVGNYSRTNTLFVANHATWLDIMAIGGTAGAAFVAKEELKGSRFVHWLASLNDSIWIQRSDRTGIHGQVNVIREVLASGRAVAFFPEATTKGGRDVLPFRTSLFSALYPPIPGIVVQPVALDYGDALDDVAWGDETGSTNVRRVFSRKATIRLRMTFGEPIVPGEDADRKVVATLARQGIVDALDASEPDAPALYPAR